MPSLPELLHAAVADLGGTERPGQSAMAQAVLDAIDKLGYRPNTAARSLITGKSDLIGLIVPDVENQYFATLAKAVDGERLLLFFALAMAAIAVCGAAAPAVAQDSDAPQVAVRYDDLNLSTTAGRDRLDTRVRTAIRAMCTDSSRLTLRQRAVAQECMAQAKRSIEPQLAALLNGSTAKFASDKPPVVAAP